jgi:hypothetical protein
MLLVGVAALLGAPAPALASRVIAPPGNSGVGQYVEVVPTAGGGSPVGSPSHGQGTLPSGTVKRLNGLGPEGKAVAAFAQQTGTPRTARHGGSATPSKPSSNGGPQVLPPTSGLRATPAGSVGGLGAGLPIVLGALALTAAAVAVGRRARTAG